MLVFDQFEGDDIALSWRQHGVYAAAVTLVAAICERHYHHACTIAQVPTRRWPDDAAIDPRVIQDAHDVLAAVWRWRASPPQPWLALEDRPRAADMADWLHWLEDEVREWHEEPDLVLAMVAIAAQDGVADAAQRLAVALRLRHAAVPWHDHLLRE